MSGVPLRSAHALWRLAGAACHCTEPGRGLRAPRSHRRAARTLRPASGPRSTRSTSSPVASLGTGSSSDLAPPVLTAFLPAAQRTHRGGVPVGGVDLRYFGEESCQ